jgi:hypothetical protein
MPTLLNGASSSERLSAIRRGYDRCLQTEYDSKGLNRRLLSGAELSYPENQEWIDHIQSAPENLFATALMAVPSPKKNHGMRDPPDRAGMSQAFPPNQPCGPLIRSLFLNGSMEL